MDAQRTRPTLAVWKFASCDGCQLSLLDCEDELLAVADHVQIAYFLEATRATVAGPYDLSLVEGSVTTAGDIERIEQIRAASRRLVTIGACATSGGSRPCGTTSTSTSTPASSTRRPSTSRRWRRRRRMQPLSSWSAGPSTLSTSESAASTGCRPNGSWPSSRRSARAHLALETVRWVAAFDFPDHEWPGELVALRIRASTRSPAGGSLDEGLDSGRRVRAHSSRNRSSTRRPHARIVDRGEYLLGPLARFGSTPMSSHPWRRRRLRIRPVADERTCPLDLAVEVLYACDEALRIIDRYREPDHPAVEVVARPGVGCGWTEAPRGMLWHRYECDPEGSIVDARIVPPTSQNQAAIERDLFHFVQRHLDLPDEELGRRAEQVIRSYDPCISCATHFLDLTVDRA